jgi:hypothetical protein
MYAKKNGGHRGSSAPPARGVGGVKKPTFITCGPNSDITLDAEGIKCGCPYPSTLARPWAKAIPRHTRNQQQPVQARQVLRASVLVTFILPLSVPPGQIHTLLGYRYEFFFAQPWCRILATAIHPDGRQGDLRRAYSAESVNQSPAKYCAPQGDP